MTFTLFRAAAWACSRRSWTSSRLQSFIHAKKKTLPLILGGSSTICLIGYGFGNVLAEAPQKEVVDLLPRDKIQSKERSEHPFPWIKFFTYVRPHLHYLLAAISTAIATFLRDIKEPAVQMIQYYAAQSLCTVAYIYSLACLGERDLFRSLLSQDVAFFDENKTGELISRLSGDVQDFKSSFKMVISQGLRSSAQATGCVASMYMISPQMTSAMGVAVPSIIIVGTYLGSFLRVLSKEAQAQYLFLYFQIAKALAVGEECIGNIRTVRAFAMEDGEMDLFSQETEKAQSLNERLGLGIGAFQGASNFFLNAIVLGTITYGGYLMSDGGLNSGQLMSFLVSVQTIQRSLTQVSLLFGHLVKGLASGSRVFEYIERVPSIPLTGGEKIPYHSFFGDIQFKNVSFSYPTRPEQVVLQDFSLRIPPSKSVALSTIAALLERFYDINLGGSIEIDGKNLRDLDPTWLRGSAIGYINQEPVLFATSVMENIRYGRPTATDAEAAKAANVDEFVSRFPSGYATVLGERGVTVSGGQKQRIAIARALLKNPSILILDEATSALDAESERLVQEALEKLSKGRSSLIIAHRLSTIRNADAIAVIDKGVVAEIGTHGALKRKGGLYARLIEQQEFRD
ncbi:ATP-binding cassette sub-family B member 8 mitochondrial [Caligus rogercresseyi]|uniref:ATP-binding cassette sub-family B member 8 mitochondrial n=1 Tax=Caligus rogercresseyi TaxID=217165 RepID=A0A7T8JVA0_CALRO|nr:ATP-binding cassette sub-family B member 8 mitochondrial [Caligus rogercresseyi]